MHSDESAFPDQAKKLHEAIPGEKELVWADGNHYDYYDSQAQIVNAVANVTRFFRIHLSSDSPLQTTRPEVVSRPVQQKSMNALVSLLQRRNECAHPSGYLPELNETLGFVSELLQRMSTLIPKTL